MTSAYTPIRGPFLKHAFAKSVDKGEDAWVQQRDLPCAGGPASLDVFGIFDGHGGKQAAASGRGGAGVGGSPGMDLGDLEEAAELLSCEQVPEGDKALWVSQDAAAVALPGALSRAFCGVQEQFFETSKVSGTTATAAVVLGWELLVANVGDSCAYLDTGAEVLLVSGNHRLDDNKAERARAEAAGAEVAASVLEGKPVGPLRVWPGGLAMSRSLGDFSAGAAVTPEPEVRAVVLPAAGARLILASDGLWDAVAPKTAAHHVRGLPASKAAMELVQLALKARGLRDDITVIVVDALPDPSARLPPPLQRRGSGPIGAGAEAAAGVVIGRPLELIGGTWRSAVWDRRMGAVQHTYGALLPPQSPSPVAQDSSGMSDGTAFDSDAAPSSFNSAELAFACTMDEQPAPADEEWETVPVKSV
ncbi:hypothetical protein WJX81_001707 [Elliptochloris bilobata]|uniref:protein-serine/threonine phosphatase n=1 Tax=Elliptochloris bilobata TaxID=381761 RepID=A0AAW1RBA4_9CHLO